MIISQNVPTFFLVIEAKATKADAERKSEANVALQSILCNRFEELEASQVGSIPTYSRHENCCKEDEKWIISRGFLQNCLK